MRFIAIGLSLFCLPVTLLLGRLTVGLIEKIPASSLEFGSILAWSFGIVVGLAAVLFAFLQIALLALLVKGEALHFGFGRTPSK